VCVVCERALCFVALCSLHTTSECALLAVVALSHRICQQLLKFPVPYTFSVIWTAVVVRVSISVLRRIALVLLALR